VTPLPGQSGLDVQPHPWLPNVYTVPFLDGHLVYAVLEWKGLVGILREVAGPCQNHQRSVGESGDRIEGLLALASDVLSDAL
jgi:hypothetical protein